MPGIIRVQAVFQGATNLPEDRFVNTFHLEWFGIFTDYDTAVIQACVAVEAFYTVPGSNGRSVGQFISPFCTSLTLNGYNMDLPEGEREPYVLESTWTDNNGTNTMPEEVAVCLTLHGEPPITPRRRGRIYIGPLMHDANIVDNSDGAAPTRVNLTGGQAIGDTLVAAAVALRDYPNFTWAIRSVTPTENYVPIAGGWVDDAFDTQRRRGPDPTARLIW